MLAEDQEVSVRLMTTADLAEMKAKRNTSQASSLASSAQKVPKTDKRYLILSLEGEFEKADVISIIDSKKETVARGITRFSSAELLEIRGKSNAEILSLHPGRTRPEVVHRDHLAPHFSNSR